MIQIRKRKYKIYHYHLKVKKKKNQEINSYQVFIQYLLKGINYNSLSVFEFFS